MNSDLEILVLEDEQRAGEKLIDLIEKVCPSGKVVWKRSVEDGISYLTQNSGLDLIFSDIELLDGNAFNIYESIRPKCPIIFCTAYNKYFVEAFQTNGIAYILKPYTEDQFNKAWEKYLLLFDSKNEKSVSEDVMQQIKTLVEQPSKSYKNRFTVKKNNGVFLLNIANVSYFQAQGDFVLAFDKKGSKHILNQSLSSIDDAIDPKKFFRINRSEIINIDVIVKFDAYTKNRLAISLAEPAPKLYTSNSRSPEFRSWLEGA